MGMTCLRSLALVLGMASSGCGGSVELATASVSAEPLTAASALRPVDDIDALDMAVDARGTVHVAWIERIKQADGRADVGRAVYRRGTGNPLRWSAPVTVPADPVPALVQLAVTDDGVHLFVGDWLEHWYLPSSASTMQSKGRLVGYDLPLADGADAIAVDGGVVVVYTASGVRSPGVHGIRLSSSGTVTVATLARPPSDRFVRYATPALAMLDGRVVAAWSEHRLDIRPDVSNTASSSLHTAIDSGAGTHWEALPASVPTAGSIEAIDAVGGTRGLRVYYASYGLYATQMNDVTWHNPVHLAAEDRRARPGSTEVRVVAAASCAGHPAVAWVDARYRHTDRRWWNPLGGIPWSDNPDWADNDVFLIGDVQADDVAAARAVPRRLTASGSFTSHLVIAPRGNELILARAGRAKVRKSREDAGAAPEVTLLRVPCG